MNEEIGCITEKRKKAMHEWKNNDSHVIWDLYCVYKNCFKTIVSPYLLNNWFKQRCIISVES